MPRVPRAARNHFTLSPLMHLLAVVGLDPIAPIYIYYFIKALNSIYYIYRVSHTGGLYDRMGVAEMP